MGQLALGIVFFAILLFLFVHWQSKGYQKYAVYVQANDASIFKTSLNASDSRIINYGRRDKEEVIAMDKDIDNGDGPDAGNLRWYICGGIDCDEGWEARFIKTN